MNKSNTHLEEYENYVPYIVVKADDQREPENIDLTRIILENPNDMDLGKKIRERFLKSLK